MANARGDGGNRFAGRRALVTGGAKGIGAAAAARLANEGAAVVIADIDETEGKALARRLGAEWRALDVADTDRVAETLSKAGPFEILINNAGADQHAFFTETTAADWRALVEINLMSVFACTHAVLPAMQAAGYGRIVNIASEAARLGSKGGSVYAAAKAGVIAFTKSIARENARYSITANAILPGPIDTPMLRAAVAGTSDRVLQAMTEATQLKRLGKPEEVAAAVAFLASDEAAYITGEVLGVSGGMGMGAS